MRTSARYYIRHLTIPVLSLLGGLCAIAVATYLTFEIVGEAGQWVNAVPTTVFLGLGGGGLAWGAPKLHAFWKQLPQRYVVVPIPGVTAVAVVDHRGAVYEVTINFNQWSQEEMLEFHSTGKVPFSVLKRSPFEKG